MNGRTHETTAVALALIAMADKQPSEVMVGCLIASIAGTIPDVDLIDNRKGKGLGMVAEVVKQSMIPICLGVMHGCDEWLIGAWLVAIIIMVLQPHRGFSHSVWCMGIMVAIASRMFGNEYILPFTIGYGSHLLLDLLNTKKVQILYPKGHCINFCKSGGIMDMCIGAVASIMIVVLLASKIMGIDIKEVAFELQRIIQEMRP